MGKIINIEDDEFTCQETEYEKNSDGSITVEGLINVYTDDGVYKTIVKVRLRKE